MHSLKKPFILFFSIFVFSEIALSQESDGDYIAKKNQEGNPVKAAGEDDLGWNFYFPDDSQIEEIEEELPLPPTSPANAQSTEPKLPPMSVAWFKENYPVIRDRAINNPTKENIAAELFAQKVMLDKSELYARTRQFVQSTDPYLQEGTRMPMWGAASTAMLTEKSGLKKEALAEVFQKAGMIVFYDDACGYCRKIIPIVNALDNIYEGLDMRVMSRNTAKPDLVPGLNDSIPVYPDEFFKLSENLPIPIQHWPAFVLTIPPNDAYIVAQGAVPQSELFNRVLNIAFEQRILGKDWFEKIHKNQMGLISKEQIAHLPEGMEDDPVALINAVVDMIKHSDSSIYDDIIGNEAK